MPSRIMTTRHTRSALRKLIISYYLLTDIMPADPRGAATLETRGRVRGEFH